MKTIIAFLLGIAGILAAAEKKDWTAWQWQAPVEVSQTGMMRLEVPPVVLDVTRPDLADLRVLSPAGDETPCLIEQSRRREGGLKDVEGFKVHLEDGNTVIEVNAETAGAIDAAELVSPAHGFLKSVNVEGRKAAGEWQTLATNEVVFRQNDGTERLWVPFSAGTWETLRFTIHDDRSQPVPFTGIRLPVKGKKPDVIELPLELGPREERPGETRLTLDLGARNLNVAELRFEIPDAVFSRNCGLEYSTSGQDGASRIESIGRCMVYRVAGDHGSSAEQLVIPIHRRIPSRLLVATFRNGDSPPLGITGAAVHCEPTVLVFHTPQAGGYQLFTGNRDAVWPVYDLNALRGELSGSGGRALTPGPLREKADFKLPPPLPGVEPSGARIDLSGWTFRRNVDAVLPGVIRVELDEKILALCQQGLGDLRLVQNDRQIPYLIKPDRVVRGLLVPASLLPQDLKRPTVSQWEVVMPVEGLPVFDLTVDSRASMFSRRFEAFANRKDELGNSLVESLGAAEWVKAQGHDTPLVIGLGGRRLPMRFQLLTDHGDNPPVTLENARVHYEASVIVAKVTEAAPLFLAYGNPKATAPDYDLRLVRSELMAAEAQSARLLEQELIHPGKCGGNIQSEKGSPWLWVALGGVVIALLVIVAKLLPKPAAP